MTTARLYWALSLKEANLMQQTLIKKGIPLNSYCWKRNIVSKISPCFVEFKYPQWINQVVSWWFCPWDEIGIVDHKELHKHYISRWTKALLTETCEEKCSDFREPYTCACSKYYKGEAMRAILSRSQVVPRCQDNKAGIAFWAELFKAGLR